MTGRSHSPPLAFVASPALRSFGPSSFAPQQFPPQKPDVGAGEHGGVFTLTQPVSSSSCTEYQALSSLQEKYQSLLSHERQTKELERSIWDAERQLYLSTITSLESAVEDLHNQLDKCQSEKVVMNDPPEQPHIEGVAVGGLGSELVEAHNEVLPGVIESDRSEPVIEQVAEIPLELAIPHSDSPLVEDSHDEAARADSPGLSEYPYPKTPKSVKGDVEPDEAEIGNLLDQAGRILGKQPYGIHHYDDEDDFEEDFRLILKPNRNFTSSWAF